MHEQRAATAATATGTHHSGRQLMHAQSLLAPWVDRYAHDVGGQRLPFPLDHGPVELLQRANQLTDSPYASAKLLDDAVILLLYGTTFLQDQYDPSRNLGRVAATAEQRQQRREQWTRQAQSIQATWRTQHFHTSRLPSLALRTSEFLQPQVDELMRRKQLKPQDSVENLVNVPIQVSKPDLETQVMTYAAHLKKRVDARRHDAHERQRKQLKDQKVLEDKRKRMVVQKKKRHERACRRWNYFATRLLRFARHNGEQESRSTTPAGEPTEHDVTVEASHRKDDHRLEAMRHALRNPTHRNFVRRFVAKAVARGVSRVLCAYNMDRKDDQPASADPTTSNSTSETTTSTTKTLRLGMLLCDLHFGVKYAGLYQRFFERVAKERGVCVEWNVFNCLKSQFPTKAHMRILNGFLVAGGPNIGTVAESSSAAETSRAAADDSVNVSSLHRRGSCGVGTRKSRHFGRWRQRLVLLLREMHGRRQTLLGGLGLGHVIIAEALGGQIGMNEWEDGWCLLDPTILSDDFHTNPHNRDRRQGQGMLGVKFLHGEFVKSIGNEQNRIKSWRSPGEHSFVACFQDKLTLSLDGSPECGAFVFETLGEFYERDKAARMRQNAVTAGSQAAANAASDRFDEEGDEGNFMPISLDSGLRLEDKRKRIGVTDASSHVARLFLDHFHRQVLAVQTPSDAKSHTIAISAVVCSSESQSVDESLRHLSDLLPTGGLFINVAFSADGHLLVANSKVLAHVVENERRGKESPAPKRPSALPSAGSSTARRSSIHRGSVGLTLAMLRGCNNPPKAGSSSQLSPRASIRLPSLRQDGSTQSLIEGSTTDTSNQRTLVQRTSTLRSSLHSLNSGDDVSVLTLSQALTLATKGDSKTGLVKQPPKRIFIRVLDEECEQAHDLLPLTKADLRSMWLRLAAAIQIADLSNDQVAIVSRHSLVLDHISRKRPMWTFVKDCRRCEVTHRKRMKKIAQYASYADIVLYDQEFLLRNSARENEILFKKAKSLGIQVYAAPRQESPVVAAKPSDKFSPKHQTSAPKRKTSLVSQLSREITNRASQISTDYDLRVVEFMLLHLSGLDGVITSHPEAAVDAQQRIAAKSDTMQLVEQLFHDWQANDSTKVASPKRWSGAPPLLDPTLDMEDQEDYVGGGYNSDSDDSIFEHEIVAEIARQRAEHFVSTPGTTLASEERHRGPSVSVAASTMGSLTAAPSAPLRPLQQKSGDEVFGATAMRRQLTARSPTTSAEEARTLGRLSSIGSFRAAMKRTTSSLQAPEFTIRRPLDHRDARLDVRPPEGTGARVLQPRSTRRLLFTMPR